MNEPIRIRVVGALIAVLLILSLTASGLGRDVAASTAGASASGTAAWASGG